MMKRLLILDDDPRICDFAAALARHSGWQVDIAHDGAGFRHGMAQARPDALFLDLRLGQTDGIEILRELSTLGFTGPIVLMSGFNDRVLEAARTIGTGFGLKIANALEKPVRAAALRAILAELGTPSDVMGVTPPAAAKPGALDIAEIERARMAGEMTLHYQPIVGVADGKLVGMEALLRWHHPLRGRIAPDRFIPVIEADGPAMDRLTHWTVDEALAARSRFDAAGLRAPIAVNISGICLRHLDLPTTIARQVECAGYSPAALSLEITESIAMVGSQQTMDILTRLRLRGFDVAIDDLGAGYASLQALLSIPFSYLKIDKAFIAGIATSRDSLSIVRAIAGMARNMALRSVAEGVETEKVAAILRDLGVQALQGAWLSMPLPADELIAWEARRSRRWFQAADSLPVQVAR